MPIERRSCLERPAGVLLGVQNAHGLFELADHDADGFHQVRVATDHDRTFESVLIAVVQEVRSQINVRALLLRLEDFDERVSSGQGMHQG